MTQPLNPRTDDQRLKRPADFWVNRCTAFVRALPDFLIIGEMKSGTSSLFHYVQRHSRVRPPIRKEIHFFSIGFGRGVRWYRSHFPFARHLAGGGITGEACPDYLFAPGADERIHRMLPGVKLIVLLRDPIERAISHYYHEVRMGRETLPILEALMAEEDRLAQCRVTEPQGLETYLHASYKRRGCYADQLERYFARFHRDQFLILGNGQLLKDPKGTTNQVYQFLGLPPMDSAGHFPRKNTGSRDALPAQVYEYLREYFEPHNQRLFELLGARLDW